jgi:hypothetical protein
VKIMSGPTPNEATPSAVPVSHGGLIALTALLGTVLVPVATWCVMSAYDRFDPMCDAGGEGGIACATRAFVVTMMSILPGLLIGVVTGLVLAARRDRRNHPTHDRGNRLPR